MSSGAKRGLFVLPVRAVLGHPRATAARCLRSRRALLGQDARAALVAPHANNCGKQKRISTFNKLDIYVN